MTNMRRQIKFRGKAKDGGWWYGSLVYFPDSQTAHIIPCGTCKVQNVICDFVEVDPATVGQYTELSDSNGKEIYEGDIITVNGRYPRVVLWDKVSWALMPCKYYNDKHFWIMNLQHPDNYWWEKFADEMEVVGNIQDNPELLKDKYHGNNL